MSHQLALTVDQALIRRSSILDLIHSIVSYLSLIANEILPTFWHLLGPNSAFLRTIIENQTRMLEKLQQQNIALQAEVHSAHSNIVDAATAAATTTVQNIQFSLLTVSTVASIPNLSMCQLRSADLERFNSNWSRTEGFLHTIKLTIMISPAAFLDDRFKILYVLSFMTERLVQIWVHDKTDAMISRTSTIVTFAEFVKCIEDAFSDPDHVHTM